MRRQGRAATGFGLEPGFPGGAAGVVLAQVVVGTLGGGLVLLGQELDVFVDGRAAFHAFGAGQHFGAVQVEGQLGGVLLQGREGGGHGHVLLHIVQVDEGRHERSRIGGVGEELLHEAQVLIAELVERFALFGRERVQVGGQNGAGLLQQVEGLGQVGRRNGGIDLIGHGKRTEW